MASSSAMLPSTSSCPSSSSLGESVIVVVDADRSRINTHSLTWALHNVVRPKDTLIVLGVVSEFGKKASCFSFFPAIGGIFAICITSHFSCCCFFIFLFFLFFTIITTLFLLFLRLCHAIFYLSVNAMVLKHI